MPTDWRQELERVIDQQFDSMVALRRRLHAHPEVSGEERETSLHLYQLLGEAGFDVRLGLDGRGVVADLKAMDRGDPGSLLALRADIDALRIHDAKQVPYRSQCDGVMHACGHDAHTAVVYGALTALQILRTAGQLPWETHLRGLFQPAEEICQGAREMISVGALEGVSAILAVHCDPSRPVGKIGVRTGVFTANCDEMKILIQGRGGHAARPHEASDPIVAAAQLINAIYLNVPRVTDSQDAVVVTIGQIQAGDNANVIPESAVLRGTIRTLDRNIRVKTMDHIRRLAHGISQTTATMVDVAFAPGASSVINDGKLMKVFRLAVREVVGDSGVDEITRASMGSEDFAYYLEHVPGAMVRLGCGSDRVGRSPLHTPTFDVDEQALRIGAQVLARAAVLWSDPKYRSGDGPDNYQI